MIIVDEDGYDVKSTQARPVRSDEEMSESSQLVCAPPPSYSASTSYGTAYNVPLQYPDDVPVHPRREFPVHGENARKRFLKAFIVGVGVWLLLAMLVQSFADLTIVSSGRRKDAKDKNSGEKEPSPGDSDGKSPTSDGRIRSPICVVSPPGSPTSNDPPSDLPYSTKLGFVLPVTSDFAFFSNDPIARGMFVIDATSTSSDVEVDVVISYSKPTALQLSKVCLTEKGTERSIGVMSVIGRTALTSRIGLLRYDIYVRLPSSLPVKEPLYISRLVADFSYFTIKVGDLSGRAEFAEIDLKTKYEAIETASLSAHKARLETSQASIRGNFTTASSLELITENAPIGANISMLSSASSDHPPTNLTMRTKNAGISARLNLSNPSNALPLPPTSPSIAIGDSVGGNFSVMGATSNAELALSIISQPYSSFLSLSAKSSNSPAVVSLPSQFSGAFRLATSIFRPLLQISHLSGPEQDQGHEKVRRRDVEMTRDETHLLEGSVTWYDRRGRVEHGGGFVDVKTSSLPAVLNL